MTQQRRTYGPVMLVGAAVAFTLLGDQALYAILPVYFEKLGLTHFHVGVLLSVNRWIRLVTNHAAERMTRRLNTTVLLAAAIVLGAGLTAIYATRPAFPILLGARLLWGLCWSILRQVGAMTAVRCAPPGGEGRLMGLYSGITRFGFIAGAFGGALLFDLVGFASTLWLLAGLSLLGTPLGVLSGRWHGAGRIRAENTRRRNGGGTGALLACGLVCGCVGPGLVAATLGHILKQRVGESVAVGTVVVGIATLNGLLLAARHAIGLLGSPGLGMLGDRIGHRRGMVAFFSAATVALLAAAWVDALIALVAAVLAFFICMTALQVILSAEAGKCGPKTYASYATTADLGAAIGPLLGWTMLGLLAQPTIIYCGGAALCAISAGLSLMRHDR